MYEEMSASKRELKSKYQGKHLRTSWKLWRHYQQKSQLWLAASAWFGQIVGLLAKRAFQARFPSSRTTNNVAIPFALPNYTLWYVCVPVLCSADVCWGRLHTTNVALPISKKKRKGYWCFRDLHVFLTLSQTLPLTLRCGGIDRLTWAMLLTSCLFFHSYLFQF